MRLAPSIALVSLLAALALCQSPANQNPSIIVDSDLQRAPAADFVYLTVDSKTFEDLVNSKFMRDSFANVTDLRVPHGRGICLFGDQETFLKVFEDKHAPDPSSGIVFPTNRRVGPSHYAKDIAIWTIDKKPGRTQAAEFSGCKAKQKTITAARLFGKVASVGFSVRDEDWTPQSTALQEHIPMLSYAGEGGFKCYGWAPDPTTLCLFGSSDKKLGLRELQFELSAPVPEKKVFKFGQDSVLTLEKNRAVWEF
jgi:hypothetical protein